jgi:hypothetical protein
VTVEAERKAGQVLKSLLRELKRRRVAKTCLLYVVLCWGALEVADVLLPTLEIDAERGTQLLFYSAIAGFPLVVAIAWFFQITPQGIVRTTNFVDRRVLNNIAPINDRRRDGVSNYIRDEPGALDHHWIITAESGALSGLGYAVSRGLVLGRAVECEITLPISHISRNHAHLYVEEDRLMIEDLKSANGTRVNGDLLVGKKELRDQDELLFHDVLFRVSENYAWASGDGYAGDQTTRIKPVDTR